MNHDEAEQAVAATQRRAHASVLRDTAQLRAHALTVAQVRADQLFPIGRQGPAGRDILTARASRILRGWYQEVYSTAVRDSLGERVAIPGVGAIDATATALRAALAERNLDPPLRLAGTLHRAALSDANAVMIKAYDTLTGAAPRRAAQHAAQYQTAGPAEAAIIQHWYQRCYLSTVDAQMGLQQPLHVVTARETAQVTASIEHRQFRQIIGADGTPLVIAQGAIMTKLEQVLAGGGPDITPPVLPSSPNRNLRQMVTQSWNSSSPTSRATWADGAGVPTTVKGRDWPDVPGAQQSLLIGRWLDTHQHRFAPARSFTEPVKPRARPRPVERGDQHLLTGPPAIAAAAMFNYTPAPLAAVTARAQGLADSLKHAAQSPSDQPRAAQGADISHDRPTRHR